MEASVSVSVLMLLCLVFSNSAPVLQLIRLYFSFRMGCQCHFTGLECIYQWWWGVAGRLPLSIPAIRFASALLRQRQDARIQSKLRHLVVVVSSLFLVSVDVIGVSGVVPFAIVSLQ